MIVYNCNNHCSFGWFSAVLHLTELLCSCIIIFYRYMFCLPHLSQCRPALHSYTRPPLRTYFCVCECCMSYPGHQLVPSRVERVHFLLYQLIQNAAVHQCLGQLSDLVPVVLWVPQKNLQTLCTHTERHQSHFHRLNLLGSQVKTLSLTAAVVLWYCCCFVLRWLTTREERKIENYAG